VRIGAIPPMPRIVNPILMTANTAMRARVCI
jgi:hypothetical protein